MICLIFTLLLLHIAPFIVTGLVLRDGSNEYDRQRKKRLPVKAVLFDMAVNTASLSCLYFFFFKKEPISKLPVFISLHATYQDIGRLGLVVLAAFLAAFIIGIVGCFLFYRRFPKFTKKNKAVFFLCMGVVMLAAGCASEMKNNALSNIQIVEVCRKAVLYSDAYTTVGQKRGSDGSYVIIKNEGSMPCEISGCRIASDENSKTVPLEDMILYPGNDFRIVMAEDEGIHIRKSGGTTVRFEDKSGRTADSVKIPALEKNQSYQLGENTWNIAELYPAREKYVQPPVFSAEAGFYENEFFLTITSAPGTAVYYSLDGSIPDTHSARYTQPLKVYNRSSEPNQYCNIKNVVYDYLNKWTEPENTDKAFVVRAVSVDADGESSDVVTRTYFVGMDKYKEKSVVSLTADPEDLFGDYGIFVTGKEYDEWYLKNIDAINNGKEFEYVPPVNFMMRGDEWEREANLEFFDIDYGLAQTLNQRAGLKIQGSSSRNVPRKRLIVLSRKELSGSEWFDTELFAGKRTHSVALREGTDNSLTQSFTPDRDVAFQRSIPTAVFLNGEYWYTVFMIERYGEKYFSETFGVSENNIECLKYGVLSYDDMEAYEDHQMLLTFCSENDFSNDAVYEEFCKTVDIQSFIDYMGINLYVANSDTRDMKNFCIWRTYVPENDGFGDGRWRWGLYDMDLLGTALIGQYGIGETSQINNYTHSAYGTPYDQQTIFAACIKNENFRRRFVLSLMDMINTDFTVERAEKILKEYGLDIEEYEDGFYLKRQAEVIRFTAEEFGLSGKTAEVRVSTNGERDCVRLNTVTPDLSEEWTGTYFTDYPITVSTDSPAFECWEITADGRSTVYYEKTLELETDSEGIYIYAKFR